LSIHLPNFYSLLVQQPVVLSLLEHGGVDSIATLMLTSKTVRVHLIKWVEDDKDYTNLFKKRLEQLESNFSSLIELYKTEHELIKLCSAKRFTKEIISLIPFLGEYVAEHLGYHFHIDTPTEAYDSYSIEHHFVEQHHQIDLDYDHGVKVDHLVEVPTDTGSIFVPARDIDHANLGFNHFGEFIYNNWQGIGLFFAKMAMVKIAPATGTLITVMKFIDIIRCYHKRNDIRCEVDGESVMRYQRLLFLLSTSESLTKEILNLRKPAFREWVLKLPLKHFSRPTV